MDDELERFKREINLTELAASLGYLLARGSRSAFPASVAMRHPQTDDKIIIRRDRDGHWTYFSVRDDRDNGSVIDFLQNRRQVGLGAVRDELRAWHRADRPQLSPELYRQRVGWSSRDLAAAGTLYTRARNLAASPYLAGRGLLAATLQDERFRGTFRVDGKGNVLFPHVVGENRSVVGYEIKNRGFTGFSPGGRRTFWLSAVRPDDLRLVIAEASIDALSYHQLHRDPRTAYLSTGGSIGAPQLKLLRAFIEGLSNCAEIVLATDNDPAGEKLAGQLAAAASAVPVRRHPPPVGKDWNEYLQTLHRSIGRRSGHGLER
jgi:Toprim-like